MKKKNLLLLFLSVFALVSCTKNDDALLKDETLLQNSKVITSKRDPGPSNCETENYLNDIDQYYILNKIKLNQLKKEQKKRPFIFGGNNSFNIPNINNSFNPPNQFNLGIRNSTRQSIESEIEQAECFNDYLLGIDPEDVPPCFPPRACFDDYNCIPDINLKYIKGIILFDNISEIVKIKITNELGEIVGSDNGMTEGVNGERIMRIEHRFTGEATMTITLKTRDCGTLLLATPVYID